MGRDPPLSDESRPNVTSDAAALAIKSGNACILRCGKEAWRSANAIVTVLRQGLKKAGSARDSGLPDRGPPHTLLPTL